MLFINRMPGQTLSQFHHGCLNPIRFRNNKKLLGRVKAFDRYASSYFKAIPSLVSISISLRHCNMVLEGVKEMWTELPKTGKGESLWQKNLFWRSNLTFLLT